MSAPHSLPGPDAGTPEDRTAAADRPALTPVPTTTPEPPQATTAQGAPSGRRRTKAAPLGWKARALVSVTWPWFVLGLLADGLILLAGAAGDLAFIKSALDPLLGQSELLSWGVSIGLSLVSLAAAVHVGRGYRKYRATGEEGVLPVAVAVGWSVLGLALFVLRIAGDATVVPGFEGAVAADDDHVLMAVVLLGMHVALGILAAVSGYAFTNPEAYALRNARWAHAGLLKRLPGAEAVFTRMATNLGARVAEMSEAEQAAETAKAVRRAVAAHVQAVARVRIAEHLGSPEDTGGTRPHPGDLLPPG